MSTHWVFFEPVNFDETVYDSDDLRSIRGASMALLQAPEAFVAMLPVVPKRQVFFSSSVICEVDMEPDEIEAAFLEFIRDPAPGNRGLGDALKDLSFSFGSTVCSGEDEAFADEMIDVRNASLRNRFRLCSARRPGKARKKLGSSASRADYYETLGARFGDNPPEMPVTFQDVIRNKPSDWPDDVKSKLQNKMVVLEFDADALGQELSGLNFDEFKAKSDIQNALMNGLIQDLCACLNVNGTLELETLLFAGDEGIVIFPIWHLERVIDVFAKHLCGPNALTTFSCGMVVCGVKTPILTVRRMTRDLINQNKEISADASTANSLLQYVVAGDVDIPGRSVREYRTSILDLQPSEQKQVFPIELKALGNRLQNLRVVKARRGGCEPAPTSHAKVKAAIERVNALRRTCQGRREEFSADWTLRTYLSRKSRADDNAAADNAAARVIGALLPADKAESSSLNDLAALLHAAALMPLIPDAEMPEVYEDSGGR